MSVEIKVPEMGESITEATLLNWSKKEGDFVQEDEVLVELETDKVTMEVRAPSSGIIQSIIKKTGEVVHPKETIGSIEKKAIADAPVNTTSPPSTTQTEKVPDKKLETKNETLSPAVNKLVANNNLDPKEIQGTGKREQITKGDVLNYIESKPSKTQDSQSQTPKKEISGDRETVVPMTKLRKTIADRLVYAQSTAAILTTFNEVDMTGVMELRNKYKEKFKETHQVGLGFMSFFTKAAISALKSFPAVNAEIRGNDIVYKNYYNIGVAVGGPKGLVVPVIQDADRFSFAGIEQEILRLAEKVKTGKISLEEMQGGTFSISNGGIYGSMMSTPILNPPQSGILGLHNITKRAVVINDEIKIRSMMYLALSYDHRIIDGKEAVLFLVKIKEAIEDPARLLLEV
ncbi:MAG: 2-oxoglutarate dehydrogenase complex dihydrolipoyllysine-residue succinyltransferase [Leptospiraceae bacterium]|nr:2-oxoglutarate dehydrogenase complex dihydrolipoyllysine-residue succinyltransferase [Leptospiraceae bacterium]MCK6380586.1 2-oxoglutarate dehydrogenase complex dihydrolipoyllysine-residue succinyltransferase [Leptospiraceae bacterium]NUM40333.1 2-oxoglutarate dehydrogenase complex dihydrolipoyllysine-residue succinyltransferase [Leptospiraceae bacterium]